MNAAMNTLKQVRDALRTLQEKQNDPMLSAEERSMVEEGIWLLSEQEDVIINNSLEEMVGELNERNEQLSGLCDRIDESAGRLGNVAKTIRKVATVVGVLTEIITKASGAGLL